MRLALIFACQMLTDLLRSWSVISSCASDLIFMPPTRNVLMTILRNVLKVARDDGLIDFVPATPRVRHNDNPRSFFRFAPLVPGQRDE